jgi:hypothetical protein
MSAKSWELLWSLTLAPGGALAEERLSRRCDRYFWDGRESNHYSGVPDSPVRYRFVLFCKAFSPDPLPIDPAHFRPFPIAPLDSVCDRSHTRMHPTDTAVRKPAMQSFETRCRMREMIRVNLILNAQCTMELELTNIDAKNGQSTATSLSQ